MRFLSRAVAGAAIAAVTVGIFLGGSAMADAARGESVADDVPPFAVETFDYPGAEEILAEQGFLLQRGDGHIVLAECGSEENLLRLLARSREDVCFRTTGTEGFLSLELDSVYGVRTNDADNTHLEMTAEGDQVEYDIPAETWEGVGEAVDGREHVLLEIRVTR
ncbi:hypothetical protein [Myceligenerans xiligouense]|uniref:Secreted protein n=1 Tax=Myceligenerans xiligouense TaxID=253184 RepID=A0A3N4YMU4_9MICO|nr:hypothetical protein [Myceligenerans xiligouense]RPF21973.1 hypothetical protein EDD34_2616 [Myceligenerans xiligouense]